MDCCATPELCHGPCPELPKPRSFWQRIGDRLAVFLGSPRAAVPPERSVAFTIAVIALGAKLAKVDGHVERSEVAAFRRVFVIPRSEEKNAARVFDLARQDVAGFDAWARRIASMFSPGDPVLFDVMEGLLIIALADGDLADNIARRYFLPTFFLLWPFVATPRSPRRYLVNLIRRDSRPAVWRWSLCRGRIWRGRTSK